MNNLLIALSLGLLNNENFVIRSDNDTVPLLTNIIQHNDFTFCIINMEEIHDMASMIPQISYINNEGHLQFKEIVVMDKFETINVSWQRELINFFNIVNDYDSNLSKIDGKNYVTVNGKQIFKSTFQSFIGIINGLHHRPVFNKTLKEKFWFSQFYANNSNIVNDGIMINDYKTKLTRVRQVINQVYESPDISTYIYSLIIHTRNHRLNTINQMQTRLHTSTIEKVSILAKSIIAWKYHEELTHPSCKELDLFLTPQIIQLSFRKIGYWLVDWEADARVFDFSQPVTLEIQNKRKLIMNMLVGEWYGSEWKYVESYMKEHLCDYDPSSPTGVSNAIIEDVIHNVRPPI